MPKSTRIGQVAQEAPGTDEPLIEIVLKADAERAALLEEERSATDPHRIAEIHTRLADIDAHSAEARAATILAGLGFDEAAQKRPAASFSGGWRMRVALASVLFAEPDLLLLDEPTNYLDLEGTLWLENYVARYPHTVLIISHDRDLLNRAVTSIVHLDQQKLTFWRGGYDQFERQLEESQTLQEKSRAKQEAARKHMEAFVERFRAKASKARQAQSRLKALEKMKPIAAIMQDSVKPFNFPEPAKTVASPIVAMSRRRHRLCARQAGAEAAFAPHRRRRSHRAAGRQRQWQVDLRQAACRAAQGANRHDDARPRPQGGDLRSAPARRSETRRERDRACQAADGRRAGSRGCARASPRWGSPPKR